VIEWMYFEGYTQREISEKFEIPLGTVKTRTRLALKELRAFFNLEKEKRF
jgi:RNA polymerase sigma-70 factor (ECF subfamily)